MHHLASISRAYRAFVFSRVRVYTGRPLLLVPQYPRKDLWRVHSFIKILFKFRLSRRRDEESWTISEKREGEREGAASGFICVASRDRLIGYAHLRLVIPRGCGRSPLHFRWDEDSNENSTRERNRITPVIFSSPRLCRERERERDAYLFCKHVENIT